jgi:hypothetical protein
MFSEQFDRRKSVGLPENRKEPVFDEFLLMKGWGLSENTREVILGEHTG